MVNVQGDEPGIEPRMVARLIQHLRQVDNPELVVTARRTADRALPIFSLLMWSRW